MNSVVMLVLKIACILSGFLPVVDATPDVGSCGATIEDGNGASLMQAKRRSTGNSKVHSIPGLDHPSILSDIQQSLVGRMTDAHWEETFSKVKEYSMVDEYRLKFAYDAVKLVNVLGIEGDIVEAGVWRGGVSMAMALADLSTTEGLDRHCWLYDTFEGLPPPGADDGEDAKATYDKIQSGDADEAAKHIGVEDGKWNYAAQEMVTENMVSTGFPSEKLHFIKGKVEDTLQDPKNLPEKISILRLDTDWYESTKAELEYLLPRLQPGGLIYLDDYCAWQGCRKAADEFFDGINSTKIQSETPFCAFAWKPSSGW